MPLATSGRDLPTLKRGSSCTPKHTLLAYLQELKSTKHKHSKIFTVKKRETGESGGGSGAEEVKTREKNTNMQARTEPSGSGITQWWMKD